MSEVIDLDKARRLQIGRRHERTFINFYKTVKDITSDPALMAIGRAETFCNSTYTQGFRSLCHLGINECTKETKSFNIIRRSGTISIVLKEPDK